MPENNTNEELQDEQLEEVAGGAILNPNHRPRKDINGKPFRPKLS